MENIEKESGSETESLNEEQAATTVKSLEDLSPTTSLKAIEADNEDEHPEEADHTDRAAIDYENLVDKIIQRQRLCVILFCDSFN